MEKGRVVKSFSAEEYAIYEQLEAENKKLKEALEWKKQVPNKEGHWLRLDAAGRVEMHPIFRDSHTDNKLSIYWGWSPQSKCLIEDIKTKLSCFYWVGPLPVPSEQALRGKRDE